MPFLASSYFRSIRNQLWNLFVTIDHNGYIKLKADSKYDGNIVLLAWPSLPLLLISFQFVNGNGSAFNFDRSSLSLLIYLLFFYLSKRRIKINIIAVPLSNINLFNCLFSILYQFSSSNKRLRSASALSSANRKILFRATLTKGEHILISILEALSPVAISLWDLAL